MPSAPLARTAKGAPAADTGRRAGLDRDEIVAAAVGLVESEGADALTMRRLAAHLGVTTTTLYWHVGSRDELVTGVIDRVAKTLVDRPIDGGDAVDRLVCCARHMWEAAITHRNVAALAHQHGASGRFLAHLEAQMLVEIEAAGLVGDDAVTALRSLLTVVAGALVVALRRWPVDGVNSVIGAVVSPATAVALEAPASDDPEVVVDPIVRAVAAAMVGWRPKAL